MKMITYRRLAVCVGSNRTTAAAIASLAFLVASSSLPLHAQICGDVVLASQADVDSFACTEVTGSIVIDDRIDMVQDITNLDGLSELTSVSGTMDVRLNDSLTSISGLGALTSVGLLRFLENASLTNLDGLAALASVGNLYVFDNDLLANVNGLSALTSVGDVRIVSNVSLTDLDGLSALTSIGGILLLQSNASLADVDGLSAVTAVGGDVILGRNDSLSNVDGLSALTSIAGRMIIISNAALIDVNGLSALTSVGGLISVQSNDQLAHFDGLSALTSVAGDLIIKVNPSLDGFCGLFPLLDAGGLVGNYDVSGNLANPTEADILAAGPCVPTNSPPMVGEITAPVAPVRIGTIVEASAPLDDPDKGDTHTAEWDWGDGSTSPGTVGLDDSVSGEHVYSASGVYTITLTVTDAGGLVDESVFQFMVVYDPSAGFVSGSGSIDSAAGAYRLDKTLAGRASFGFVSRYSKGASIPTGQTTFQFSAGDLQFSSTAYEWLVIAGARATYKGVGTINGAGNFGFQITAVDEALTNSTEVDLLRIKIWDRDDFDEVVYDNQLGDRDDLAEPETIVSRGAIVIHD